MKLTILPTAIIVRECDDSSQETAYNLAHSSGLNVKYVKGREEVVQVTSNCVSKLYNYLYELSSRFEFEIE